MISCTLRFLFSLFSFLFLFLSYRLYQFISVGIGQSVRIDGIGNRKGSFFFYVQVGISYFFFFWFSSVCFFVTVKTRCIIPVYKCARAKVFFSHKLI
ncbi:hypothetical protein HOY80DRAFT_463042 [Tuber brumale]|nr:hypothetical protein HOY80DRAFT_463042 [Tuber brumale]